MTELINDFSMSDYSEEK